MVLITGATGMVGQYLLEALLKQNQQIRALYRTEEKRERIKKRLSLFLNEDEQNRIDHIDWFKGDVTDIANLPLAFEQITQVYHCAGLVSFDIGDKKKLRKINIEGTANVVNCALSAGVQKFCHLSSVAALGDEPNGKAVHEESLRNNSTPHNYYSISKYGGEIEVWRASQEGLPVVIVNPAIILGAGNWHSGSGQIVSRAAKGFPFKIPKQSGFIGATDVVDAMIKLMQSSIKNERFILVSEICSFSEITNKIADQLNAKRSKYPLKKWMLYLLWVGQSINYLLFRSGKQITRQSIKEIFKPVNFDTSKIENRLNFKFTPMDKVIEEVCEKFPSKK